jgi:hexosaminidase
MKPFFIAIPVFFIYMFLTSCDKPSKTLEFSPSIIPKPRQMDVIEGSFAFNKNTTIFVENEFKIAEDFLQNYLQKGAGLALNKAAKNKATIVFEKDPSQPNEGYLLDVSEYKIIVKAADAGGAFYAVQTLRQLLPVDLERNNSVPDQEFLVPIVQITDAPKFKYRGMHLDVGRHFFDKEFIKEYIANLSMLKMNYFHWHLTEDQGWRIEIKQYPKLTSHAAYRDETLIGHYNDRPHQFDGQRYGGFYTQEDIKEIVAFATQHNVTIIPEIEMPGHAQAAISAYPELGCTGEEVPVATKWGIFENIYCPNEETFTFLKNVLTEVMELFPGEYIHIGGDEAPKKQWENCVHCQKLIKDLDLKDENGLQSYFIKKMEKFLNSKGKKIIGWDEILEGGLAPNATVMSWRGTLGAVAGAKEGHDVILTPGSHAYFDHYQANYSDEPLAIGGFLPLKKVYGFNPVPEELTTEEAVYVLGAQGNVWTEYMTTTDHVEYMVFPRILAMSEVVWSGASNALETDYPEFLSRLESFMKRMDALDINYANHLYDVSGLVIKRNDSVFYELKTPTKGKEIRYSINNSAEQKYSQPILISEDTQLHAQLYDEIEKIGRPFSETIRIHKAINGKVTLNVPPNQGYDAGGKEALINGISGSDTRYGDKEWLGFWGEDVEITLDLKEETKLNSISLRFFNASGQWIHAPNEISFSCVLPDGTKVFDSVEIKADKDQILVSAEFDFSTYSNLISKNITLKIPNYGTIPSGFQGAGNKAWTFIDEIIIE